MHHNERDSLVQRIIAGSKPLLIISPVSRRFHITQLIVGPNPLDARQSKHAREALRLQEGVEVELFDDAGALGTGVLCYAGRQAIIQIDNLHESQTAPAVAITVAAAIPKGERADWMVEKLSELGVAMLIPLAAARSVVLPQGSGKRERWQRIATESAKQSRRHGVMQIAALAKLQSMVLALPSICLSTRDDAAPLPEVLCEFRGHAAVMLLVGPEGGWTDGELEGFQSAGVRFARMTESILRIETAAVAAAAVAAMLLARS